MSHVEVCSRVRGAVNVEGMSVLEVRSWSYTVTRCANCWPASYRRVASAGLMPSAQAHTPHLKCAVRFRKRTPEFPCGNGTLRGVRCDRCGMNMGSPSDAQYCMEGVTGNLLRLTY